MLFILQKWSKNIRLSKANAISCVNGYPIHCTWNRISLLLTDPIYSTNKNSNGFLWSHCLFMEIRVGYYSWDSFSSILSSLSVFISFPPNVSPPSSSYRYFPNGDPMRALTDLFQLIAEISYSFSQHFPTAVWKK